MAEEILIPKMKRLSSRQKKVKIPINNFVLIILCVLLIIGATFVNITIKHFGIPAGFSFGKHFDYEDYVYTFSIIPQIPVLMFVCSGLGKKLATTCTFLYIVLGLAGLPVFALGGGLGYIGEYSFGYILAYLPAVFIAGSILRKKYSFLKMFLAALAGVLIIHFCGIFYMVILALLKREGGVFIGSWIAAQSGLKIIYDIVLSFIAILIGKYINEFLKFLYH